MSDFTKSHRPLYRVFHLKRDGGIARADIIEALDDEHAIELLRAMADDHSAELWDRARFIAKIEPAPAALNREPILVRGEPVVSTALGDASAPASPAKLAH